MTPIPKQLKKEMQEDTFYTKCCLKDTFCDGRITWEHTMTYAGKQIQEKWAIIPICEYHHAVNKYQDGGNLNKEKNRWVAFNRATEEELSKFEKASPNFINQRNYLNSIYGTFTDNHK